MTSPRGLRYETILALLTIGITSVAAQAVLMREFLAILYGNELALGMMLASWLIWTAVGSLWLGRSAGWRDHPFGLVALLQTTTACVLPGTVLVIRMSGIRPGIDVGQISGPGTMLAASFLLLGGFCLLSGALFSSASLLYCRTTGETPARSTTAVYLFEALGSVLGGLLVAIVLIPLMNNLRIVLLISLLNLASATLLALRRRWRAIMLCGLGLLAIAGLQRGADALQQFSLMRLWKGFRVLEALNTPYANLVVVEKNRQRSLYGNGIRLFSFPDQQDAEESVHLALLEHPRPRRVLLLGGGISGSLSEILKHPSVEQLTYVELDPGVFDLARRHFPESWNPIEAEGRIRVFQSDARSFVRQISKRFDVIIAHLPEPNTVQFNRFYTLEFFEEIRSKLLPGGVFSFQVSGSENYLGDELSRFLRCVNQTLATAFPEVAATPGDVIHFFASNRKGLLTTAPEELVNRLRLRRLNTVFVSEFFLPFQLRPDRLGELEAQLERRPDTALNRDFSPIAFYLSLAQWVSQFPGFFQDLVEIAGGLNFGRMAGAALILNLVVVGGVLRRRRRESWTRWLAGTSVMTMGLSLLSVQMLLLLGFQVLYGFLYSRLAVLVACCMLGISIGCYLGAEQGGGSGPGRELGAEIRRMVAAQAMAVFLPSVIALSMEALSKLPDLEWVGSSVWFPLLAAIPGVVGGYQFAVGSRVYLRNQVTPFSGNLGGLYALDLFGACLGAVVFSTFLVPVLGFTKSALVISMVALGPLLAGIFALRVKRLA